MIPLEYRVTCPGRVHRVGAITVARRPDLSMAEERRDYEARAPRQGALDGILTGALL